MRKIFLVSEYALPSQNTTGYLFYKLYKNLEKRYGNDLKLIVKEDKDQEIVDAILVSDVNLNKKKLFQRALYELIISMKFLWKILFNVKKNDIVFNVTNPILLLPMIYFAKKIIGFKWVLLVHDVFPENLVAAKILKPSNFFYKGLKLIFDIIYRNADEKIVIGKDMKYLIDQKVKKNCSHIVHNWVDHHDITLSTKLDNPLLKKLNWEKEDLILSFFGNIGRVQGLDNIMKAIDLIPKNDRPKVLFIGDGAYAEELKAWVNTLEDDNIKYIGAIDPIFKSDGLNACDISIVTLADGMYGLGVPSKAYYSMAANKVLLSIMDEDTEVSSMVREYDIGWCVPANQPQILAETLLEIKNTFCGREFISPREVLIKNYSEQGAMKKIASIIDQPLQ